MNVTYACVVQPAYGLHDCIIGQSLGVHLIYENDGVSSLKEYGPRRQFTAGISFVPAEIAHYHCEPYVIL
jgi:hypothetical protein